MNKYFLNCYSAQPLDGVKSMNVEDVTCPLDHELLDSLCPVNLQTGLREDLLVRVNDPNISDSERQALLASLPKIRIPSPDGNVDDETKLMFTKLRSIQTPAELSAFRSSIQSWLDAQDQPNGQPNGQPNDQPSDQPNDQPNDQPSDQ